MPRTYRIGYRGERGCYKVKGVWIPGCMARANNVDDCSCEVVIEYSKAETVQAIVDLGKLNVAGMDGFCRTSLCESIAEIIRSHTLGGENEGPEWWRKKDPEKGRS